MDNLEYYFQTHGLALLHDTQYTVTWNFESNHEILSGDAYLLRIPVEPKSSFQLLESGLSRGDYPNYIFFECVNYPLSICSDGRQ